MIPDGVLVRPATAYDAGYLSSRLRLGDLEEIAAASGRAPVDALTAGVRAGGARVIVVEGELVGMFGCAPGSLATGLGVPWLLGTDALSTRPGLLLRPARAVVAGWLREYPRLANFVDARHAVAIRWLRWLGFTVDPAAPWGVAGLPFHRFWMERPDV